MKKREGDSHFLRLKGRWAPVEASVEGLLQKEVVVQHLLHDGNGSSRRFNYLRAQKDLEQRKEESNWQFRPSGE